MDENRYCIIPYCQVVTLTAWQNEGPEIYSHQGHVGFSHEVFQLKFCKYEVLRTKKYMECPHASERVTSHQLQSSPQPLYR